MQLLVHDSSRDAHAPTTLRPPVASPRRWQRAGIVHHSLAVACAGSSAVASHHEMNIVSVSASKVSLHHGVW